MKHNLNVLFIILSIFLLISIAPLHSQSSRTVRLDITFTSDWATLLTWHMYDAINNVHGFRPNAYKLTMNGTLSHFSITRNRIQVYKDQQYDTTPVKVSVLCDTPNDYLIFYTTKGKIAAINVKAYDMSGNFIGEFTDDDNSSSRKWTDFQYFRIENIPVTSVQSNDQKSYMPQTPNLKQNYPNPFNPKTNIEYSVDHSGPVEILIFNQLGQKVRTLVDVPDLQPGHYSVVWDGKDDNSNPLASGAYYYQIRTQNFVSTKKAIFLK